MARLSSSRARSAFDDPEDLEGYDAVVKRRSAMAMTKNGDPEPETPDMGDYLGSALEQPPDVRDRGPHGDLRAHGRGATRYLCALGARVRRSGPLAPTGRRTSCSGVAHPRRRRGREYGSRRWRPCASARRRDLNEDERLWPATSARSSRAPSMTRRSAPCTSASVRAESSNTPASSSGCSGSFA